MTTGIIKQRPMSVLLLTTTQVDETTLRYGLQESLESLIGLIETTRDVQKAIDAFQRAHHDMLIIHGMEVNKSRILVNRIRQLDGKRHTGIVVMAPVVEGFDRVVVDHYNSGADEVVPLNLSLAILKPKIMMIYQLKLATDQLRAYNHKLGLMALTDELTGCANMRGFTNRFNQVLDECAKGKFGIAVVMMDLDRFKQVNDTYNHLMGSFVIKSTGQLLSSLPIFEQRDLVARYGGDEFVILLTGDDPKVLESKVELICRSIREHLFQFDGHTVRVTASLGMVFAHKGYLGLGADLVKAADGMLYKSKDLGRNKVSFTLADLISQLPKVG